MKLIATSNFRNTHNFKVQGRKAGDFHIGKGDIFEANLEDAKTAEVIAIMGYYGRIVDVDNQPEVVAQIQAEVEAEKEKEADSLKKTPKYGLVI